MKKIVIIMFFLLIVNVSAKVKVSLDKCIDGDTFRVIINNKVETIRLLAVDTPESVHPNKEVEFFGKEASEYTCNLLEKAKKISLEFDEKSDERDKYDRILAYAYVDDIMLEELLVENGYAEVAYLYDDYKYASKLQDLEKIAQEKKVGIWQENNLGDVFYEDNLSFWEIIWGYLIDFIDKILGKIF